MPRHAKRALTGAALLVSSFCIPAQPAEHLIVTSVSGPCYSSQANGQGQRVLRQAIEVFPGQLVHCDLSGTAVLKYVRTNQYIQVKPVWTRVEPPLKSYGVPEPAAGKP